MSHHSKFWIIIRSFYSTESLLYAASFVRLLLASTFFATAAKGTTESQQNLSSDRTPHVLAPHILHCDGNWWCSYVNYNTSGSHRVTNGGGGGECHCSRSCARRERWGMRDTRRTPPDRPVFVNFCVSRQRGRVSGDLMCSFPIFTGGRRRKSWHVQEFAKFTRRGAFFTLCYVSDFVGVELIRIFMTRMQLR